MADGVPPRDPGRGEPAQPPQQRPQSQPQSQSTAEPPPLEAIRVQGAGARGLNKPAILIAAGSGVAAVLVMASGAFSADPARRPAEVKPVMSDPARPEMARGAIRGLPVDYTQVATSRLAEPDPVQPPRLGPPLPGDIAAFAPDDRRRPPDTPGATQRVGEDGSSQGDSSTHHPAPDPGEAEERDAQKAGLFFALREPPQREGPATQSPTPQPTSSPLSAFLPQARDTPPETGRERMLFPGAVIAASLITEVNSESAGPVIAQVTQAVHDSATGRILLIPQGARLIGDYQSSTRYGQSRVAIVWSRLIMPDGDEVKLDEAAVDPSGAAGVSGQVDNHWTDVFGAAALGTLISIGVATTEEPQLTYGGLGVTTRDPVDAAIADGIQRSASTVTNRVVDRGLARPPTIRVAAGAKVAVIVTRRMAF